MSCGLEPRMQAGRRAHRWQFWRRLALFVVLGALCIFASQPLRRDILEAFRGFMNQVLVGAAELLRGVGDLHAMNEEAG
jgi:hypothetical protein